MTETENTPPDEPETELDDAELDDAAEAVEPDDDDDDDDDETDEDEAEQQASSTAIVRALEREHTRHAKAVAKALGLTLDELHDCPTCEGVGFTPEPIEAEPEIPFDPFLTRCERCNGTARVRTGATSLGLDVIPCPVCQEKGYVQLPEQPTAGATPTLDVREPNGQPAGGVVVAGDTLTVAEARARGYVIVDPTPPSAPVAT